MEILLTSVLFVLGLLLLSLPIVAIFTAARAERRASAADRRYDTLQRHVRSLEARIGSLEHPRHVADAAPEPAESNGSPLPTEPISPEQPVRESLADHTPRTPSPGTSAGPGSDGPPLVEAPIASEPAMAEPAPRRIHARKPAASRAVIAPRAARASSGHGAGASGGGSTSGSSRWEERIGTRLAVWVGAVALALAGLFLLRYVHQQGWVNPLMRVLGAAAFGTGLLVVGEWLRKSTHRIAQGATAAGVAVLFGTVLAATQLYGFLSPVAGFLLLAVVTAVAVISSVRQGPVVAILGLVGGFLTPVFIGTSQLSAVHLFGYLFLLEAGLLALTHRRAWWWLGVATMVGGLGWATIWLLFFHADNPAGGSWVGMFLLLSIAMFVTSSLRSEERLGPMRVASLIPWSGVGIGMLLVAWLLGAGEQTNLEWAYLGLLGAGCLVLARLRGRFFGLAALASAMPLVLLATWAVAGNAAGEPLRFAIMILSFGLLFVGGAYANLWSASSPARWATMVVLVALAGTLVGYLALGDVDGPLPWWGISLAVGGVMTALAIPVARRRKSLDEGETVLALLLTGVTGSVAIAVPMFVSLHQAGAQWMTVAWALQIPALVFIGRWLRVPALHRVAGALGALVAARLLLNPAVLTYAIGPRPVLNWLAYGYGVPFACIVTASWLLRREKAAPQRSLVRAFDVGSIALGFAMATLMVRHGFHADLQAGGSSLYEMATYSVVWGLAGAGMLLASRMRSLPMVKAGGEILAALSMLASLVGVGLVKNPLWNAEAAASVGGVVVFNGLLYAVALPALLAAALAWLIRRGRGDGLADAFDSGTLVLVMLGLGLLVRHAFHPDAMQLAGGTTLYELTTYSVAWFALGSMMLALVRRLGSPMAIRLAQAVIFTGLLSLVIGPGLFMNPLWNLEAARSVGALPVFNGLLYVVLVPVLLVGVLSWQSRRGGMLSLAVQLEHVTLALTLAGVTLLLRHAFHAGDMRLATWFTLVEVATYGVAWLAAGLGLLTAGRRWTYPLLRPGGQVMALLGLAAVWFGTLVIANPVLAHEPVGSYPVLNWLLYVYGVPAVLTGLVAGTLRRQDGTGVARAGALTTLLLAFTLITLEVRQAFHGTYLDGGTLTVAESYAYSAAWVAFAVALLLLGIGTGSRMMRHASLVTMLLSVGKVFLFDTRHLEDLYRVMSFLGLGISLFGVAYVYQRFVFRSDGKREATLADDH